MTGCILPLTACPCLLKLPDTFCCFHVGLASTAQNNKVNQLLGTYKAYKQTSKGWKLRSNDEIYQRIENITETMRKRRLLFFGHLYTMDDK